MMDGARSDTPAPEGAPPKTDDGPANPLKILVEAGVLTGFAAAIVFVAGWSYADRFFAKLGLNLSAVDGIEAQSFSAYALWVFRDAWLMIGALIVISVTGMAVVIGRPLTRRWTTLQTGGGLALLAVLALLGSGHLGSARAERQFESLFATGFETFVRVRVVAKPETALLSFLAERGDLGASTCLRKIFMDRKHLYAYAGYQSSVGLTPNVYIMALDDIGVIEVVRNPALCGP